MSTPAVDPGFIHVSCDACGDPNVWFTCNACRASDRFVKDADGITCGCGAVYDRGVCTCGATVTGPALTFVAFDKGPLALAQLEIAWPRVVALALLTLGLAAAGAFAAFRWWA